MKFRYNFLLSALCGLAFTACSNIDDDERLIYVEPVTEMRNVLIEDFTGQKCPNCPNATDKIASLHEEYGDKVIAVAIHSGPLGFAGNANNVGLKTELGDVYYNAWVIDFQPRGVIDRNGAALDFNFWQEKVRTEIQRSTPLTLNLSATLAADANSVDISLEAYATETVNGKVQLWILEDSIVAMQTMPDGKVNREYVHNHVLRSAPNGDWGEDVSIVPGDLRTITCNAPIAENWNKNQLSVVAFVYNEGGVVQVVKTHVDTKQE